MEPEKEKLSILIRISKTNWIKLNQMKQQPSDTFNDVVTKALLKVK